MLRIRDVFPGSEFFLSRIQGPGAGSTSKNLSFFNSKKCFLALGNIIWDFHHGSGSGFFTHPGSQIPGSRGQKGTGSRITDPGSATLEGTGTIIYKKVGKRALFIYTVQRVWRSTLVPMKKNTWDQRKVFTV